MGAARPSLGACRHYRPHHADEGGGKHCEAFYDVLGRLSVPLRARPARRLRASVVAVNEVATRSPVIGRPLSAIGQAWPVFTA